MKGPVNAFANCLKRRSFMRVSGLNVLTAPARGWSLMKNPWLKP